MLNKKYTLSFYIIYSCCYKLVVKLRSQYLATRVSVSLTVKLSAITCKIDAFPSNKPVISQLEFNDL